MVIGFTGEGRGQDEQHQWLWKETQELNYCTERHDEENEDDEQR